MEDIIMYGIKNLGMPGYAGNPLRIHINHPMADEISYFEEPDEEDCFEVAFFVNRSDSPAMDWVTEVVPELSLWAENDYGLDSRVYRYVPKEVVYTFLTRFESD
jgi:hypothetical protein